MTEPLRVAVLGAGDMGGKHVDAWQSLGHQVTVLADIDRERAATLAERHGVPRTVADYRAAIAAPDVDVVVVSLPLRFHALATIFAAQQGKHVLCEKPLCRTPDEAEAMEAAVLGAGVHFGVGFQRNLMAGVGLLRTWAAEGRFGRPLLFSSDLLQTVRPKIAMHDRYGNGGPLTDTACHYYLLWQSVFRSKPTRVYAQGRVLAIERPEVAAFTQLAVDTAVVTVEYQSGDIGTFTVSWGLAEGFPLAGRPDRLLGPKGGAEGGMGTGFDVYDGDRKTRVDIDRQDMHRVEAGLFADAVRGGPPFPYGFREGVEMLTMTRAVYESIDTGAPVPVRYD
ncbi:MAG: Gfo/Idh/MocA family oxidoreductase [Candidatus Dormiibacterota bacterium]